MPSMRSPTPTVSALKPRSTTCKTMCLLFIPSCLLCDGYIKDYPDHDRDGIPDKDEDENHNGIKDADEKGFKDWFKERILHKYPLKNDTSGGSSNVASSGGKVISA